MRERVRMQKRKILMVIMVLILSISSYAKSKIDQDYFVNAGSVASPELAYAFKSDTKNLVIVLKVAMLKGITPEVKLGLKADKVVFLNSADAKKTDADDAVYYTFGVPVNSLSAKNLTSFRMGIDARWYCPELGMDMRHERYLHTDQVAAHSGLSTNSKDWTIISVAGYNQLVKDRKEEIKISLKQPLDGKYSLVIEDSEGNRVRNLKSGISRDKGRFQVEWDGLDENGNLVKPGEYKWRSLHHAGINPDFLMSFCNGGEDMFIGFGSNHSRFVHAATNGKYTFLAAPMTEGGWEMIAVDSKGKWQKGFRQAHGSPIQWVQVAADDKYFYAVHDGIGWGKKVDKSKPNWTSDNYITLTRFDINSTQIKNYAGRNQYVELDSYEYGPGAKNEKMRKQLSVKGAALLNGKLYVSLAHSNKVIVVNADTAKVEGNFDLQNPGSLHTFNKRVYAVTNDSLVSFADNGSGLKNVISRTGMDIHGLTIASDGNIFLADHKSHTIKCYSIKGKELYTLGKEGGPYKGGYVTERMVRPLGMVVSDKLLWVTEDRWNPKRVLAWDLNTRKIVIEKFGNPHYGSPRGSFDEDDHTRWIGMGAQWNINLKDKIEKCKSIMQPEEGHLDGYYKLPFRYKYYKKDGRTFLLGAGKIGLLSEVMPDGSVRDLAAFSGLHLFAYGCSWKLPPAMEAVLPEKYLALKAKRYRTHKTRTLGVLWVDKNGDGSMQSEEFSFHDGAMGYSSAWGNNQNNLDFYMPIYDADGKAKTVMLKADGYYPGGAPKYPDLSAAVTQAVTWEDTSLVDPKQAQSPTTVDRWGNIIFNSNPEMLAVSPEGKILWHYPNNWVGVHGSHKAPLPETGVMQGNLFFLGCTPLDDQSDVFVLNGNHGRFFLLTSDGIYLDEMFRDVRTGRDRNAMMIGGEAFGGFFARSRKDDQFYLQTGGDGYRIYRLNGLHDIKRQSGKVTVGKDQLMAAERKLARKIASEDVEKEALITTRTKKIKIDGDARDWPRKNNIEWDKSGQFAVKIKASYDDTNLYLYYNVRDDSPWVNNGKDWMTLFKTGDSVDLQIAIDETANPARKNPVPGDMRLLIAPFNGKDIAVLYKHRVKGEKQPEIFTSPWRSETVDLVKKLENIQVKIRKGSNYYNLEVAIPLVELDLQTLKNKKLKADFGVIYGDTDGTINFMRNYWANQATALVNDVPGEIMLFPYQWGTVRFN